MFFYIKAHQHKASALIYAMREHRHPQVMSVRRANVIFLDYAWHGVWAGIPNVRIRGEALAAEQLKKPLFLYPHSVRPDLPYDIEPYYYEKVKANFVFGPGHKEVLRMLDYPCQVEVMGWSYTERLPFQPSRPDGKIKVLFAPIHPIGRSLPEDEKALNARTYETLLGLLDKDEIELTVRHIHKLEYNGLWKDERVGYLSAATNGSTTEIRQADVVIAAYTFASMAAALGKPLIMMGDRMRSHNTPRDSGTLIYARNWDTYAEYKRFPLNIEDVTGKPERLLSMVNTAMEGSPAVEAWKKNFIGEAFEPDWFVRKVESYL